MPNGPVFIVALLVQVAAQSLLGVWGAAAGGLIVGLMVRGRGAFRVGFGSAMVAAALLLGATAMRGAPLWHWAAMIAASFQLPAWGIVALTLLLPALQAGGIAGGVGHGMAREARSPLAPSPPT